MHRVVVVMSAYNGCKTISRQLDSILSQESVDIKCFVRNDGSTDITLDVLKEYAKNNSIVIVKDGNNMGWEKSFMIALKEAPEADFYAFSDQDDIWFPDKIKAGIDMLSGFDNNIPLMYHCNKISVHEDLTPLPHQIRRTPRPLNHQNAMVQEYAQGCSIIMNNKARELVTSYIPQKRIAHDFWCGLLCYLFGQVIYDDNKFFYHISYGSNASGEGHMLKSWINRLRKLLFNKEVYYSPCQDLLDGYSDMLSEEDRRFCKRVINYRSRLKDKLYLLFSKKFIRDSILGTISLKTAVLLNKL